MRAPWEPTDRDVDGMMLLIARGATLAQVGASFGVSGRTVGNFLPKQAGYHEARAARQVVARKHGIPSTYRRGCRCIECREANAEHGRLLRSRKDPPIHGTVSAYRNHGCRCDGCREVGRQANAELRLKIKSGKYKLGHGTSQAMLGCACYKCAAKRHDQRKRSQELNDTTREVSVRHYLQWTGPELEIALQRAQDGNWLRSATEVARLTGRTFYAVQRKRALEGDPRVGDTAGVVG